MRQANTRLVQGQVHRVGVAAEVVTGLKQGDVRLPAQPVRHRQTGDARTDDRQFHAAVPGCSGAGPLAPQGPAEQGLDKGRELDIKRVGHFVTDR